MPWLCPTVRQGWGQVVQCYRVLSWPCLNAEDGRPGTAVCKTVWYVYCHLSSSLRCESTDLENPQTVMGKVSWAQVVHWALMIFGCYIRFSILEAKDGNQGGRPLHSSGSIHPLWLCLMQHHPIIFDWGSISQLMDFTHVHSHVVMVCNKKFQNVIFLSDVEVIDLALDRTASGSQTVICILIFAK